MSKRNKTIRVAHPIIARIKNKMDVKLRQLSSWLQFRFARLSGPTQKLLLLLFSLFFAIASITVVLQSLGKQNRKFKPAASIRTIRPLRSEPPTPLFPSGDLVHERIHSLQLYIDSLKQLPGGEKKASGVI